MLLEQLETFARVVEAGSFTRAAQALDLSQPAVTKQVVRLERRLAAPLLRRRPGGIALTPAGEVAYAYARRLGADARRLATEVAQVANPGWGTLTVAGVDAVVLCALPPVLGAYRERLPGVHVRVRTGSIREVVDLLSHAEADIGLVSTPVSHAAVDCAPLFWDPVRIVAAPALAASLPNPLSRQALSQVPAITYQARSRFRAFLDASLAEHGVSLSVQMEFDTHEAVRTMATLGLGVALLPGSAVAEDLARGRLAPITVEGLPEVGRMASLLVRKDRRDDAAVAAFAALIGERFAAAPARA